MIFFTFKAGSSYAGSEIQGSNVAPNISKRTPISIIKEESSDLFWKGFAIFITVTLIMATIVSLIVYFIFKSHWLLIEE